MCVYDLLPGSSWQFVACNETKSGKDNARGDRTRMQMCLDAISRVLDVEDEDDTVRFGACDPIWYPRFLSRGEYYSTDDEASQSDEDDDDHRAECRNESDSAWSRDKNSGSYWVEDGASRTIAEGVRWPSHVQSRLSE